MRDHGFYFFVTICVLCLAPLIGGAQTEQEIQAKIEERNKQIKQLEEEIQVYNGEIQKTSQEKQSLQNTIKSLDLTNNKLKKDLTLTEKNIDKTNLTITYTKKTIDQTQDHIDMNKDSIAKQIQNMNMVQQNSLIEEVLAHKKISDTWNSIVAMQQFQNSLSDSIKELEILKDNLSQKKQTYESEKNKLEGLKKDISAQKQSIESTKKEKSTILAITKNKEDSYKQLLKQKQAQKDAFEKELFEFESQLNYTIDPSKLPTSKSGVLSWPLDRVIITQTFGKTVAAKRLYVSGSHNGVDFGASIGTPVKATLSGTVWGTGNTDAYPGCYSFGKWVMIKHPNGLSTIYGHLSAIRVQEGDTVSTGDVIGLSGNTGYSTGPHLHLGVYATQGVRIEKYTNSRGCKQATMPLADIHAYLDPMLYLPSR
jgi:murein DD-endopeptidase MepM/ murein hydrolase activator NlpD